MPTKSLSDDLLFGADAIARYLGKPRWWVYHNQNCLPIDRTGQTLTSTQSRLDRHFSGVATALSKSTAA
jgi:hypothetical protein